MTKNAYRKLLKDTIIFLKRQQNFCTITDHKTLVFFQNDIEKMLPQKKEETVITLKTISSSAYYEKPKKIYSKPKVKSSLTKKDIVPITFEKPKPKNILKLEPIVKTSSYPDNIQSLLQAVAPRISYLDTIPDDKKAKEIAQSWKYQSKAEPICMIIFSQDAFAKTFIKQLQRALRIVFFPTAIIDGKEIEKNDYWNRFLSNPTIKLIIMQDKDLKNSPNLLCHIKELPNKPEKFLHNVPVFLLPDLFIYEKNFHLKSNLYKALKHKISRLSSIND